MRTTTNAFATGPYPGQGTFPDPEEPQSFHYESSSERYTSSTSRVKKEHEPAVEIKIGEALVSEVSGVVLGLEGDRVRVRLSENLVVHFPIVLFSNRDLVRLGQPIKYQIKISRDGIRYQDFQPDETIRSSSSDNDEILSLLDGIEFREEN